jgi:hypothetical protein
VFSSWSQVKTVYHSLQMCTAMNKV